MEQPAQRGSPSPGQPTGSWQARVLAGWDEAQARGQNPGVSPPFTQSSKTLPKSRRPANLQLVF